MTTSEAFFSLFGHFAFYLESATKLVRAFALKGLSDSLPSSKGENEALSPPPRSYNTSGEGCGLFLSSEVTPLSL